MFSGKKKPANRIDDSSEAGQFSGSDGCVVKGGTDQNCGRTGRSQLNHIVDAGDSSTNAQLHGG